MSHLLGLGEAQSFDFSVDNQLLRCPLEKFFRIAGINTVRWLLMLDATHPLKAWLP